MRFSSFLAIVATAWFFLGLLASHTQGALHSLIMIPMVVSGLLTLGGIGYWFDSRKTQNRGVR
jgi:hypothetical protein